MKAKTLTLIIITCFTATLTLWGKSEKKQPDSYNYTRGVEAFDEQKYDEALEWFNCELSDNPDNGYALVYVGLLREYNDEYGRALSAYDKALNVLPKKDKLWRSMAMYYRSNVYIATGDTIKAIDELTKAAETNPTNSNIYYRRAVIYSCQGDYARSDADGQKLIELDRGSVMGYMVIGCNANEQERWDDALKQFNMVVKLAPDYVSGYSFRAVTYMGMDKWDEATDDLIKALGIDADEMAFDNAMSLTGEAATLLKSKLKIQMNKEPNMPSWPYIMAVYAYTNEQWSEAISWFEKANAIDAKSVCLELIAKSYLQLNRYNEALDYVDQAIDMDSEDYDLVGLRADILASLGRYDECLAERDRYVTQNPEEPYAYGARANDLMSAKRYKEAIEDFNTAIILNPELNDIPFIMFQRGEAYRLTGQPEEAAKDYNRIIQLEKDSVMDLSSCSPYAYSALGNIEKSIETMQQILKNDTTNRANTLYNAACIYARIGQKKEAVDYLRQAVDNGYDDFRHIQEDYDMDVLRDMPEFKKLMEGHETPEASTISTADSAIDYVTERVEVPFTKEGGVTKVKCTINGLPLHFIFDTGASTVSLSMVEAGFMLKNDYIKKSDIVGSSRFLDANGDITEGTIVNLRKVDFAGLELENVQASVVRNQKAPLLLGQSVLGRLGKIEINNTEKKLVITHRVKK